MKETENRSIFQCQAPVAWLKLHARNLLQGIISNLKGIPKYEIFVNLFTSRNEYFLMFVYQNYEFFILSLERKIDGDHCKRTCTLEMKLEDE